MAYTKLSGAARRKIAREKAKTENGMPANRDKTGKFLPGMSGNPNGRPPTDPELKELARTYTSEAIVRLVHWMRSDDSVASLAATRELLSRGHGKPEISISSPGGALVNINVNSGRPITDATEASRIYAEILGNPALDVSGLTFASPVALPAPHEAAVDAITIEPSQGIKCAAIASHVDAGALLPRGTPDDEENS